MKKWIVLLMLMLIAGIVWAYPYHSLSPTDIPFEVDWQLLPAEARVVSFAYCELGTTFTSAMTAVDYEGDSYEWVAIRLPQGGSFDANQNVFTWRPVAVGSDLLIMRITDIPPAGTDPCSEVVAYPLEATARPFNTPPEALPLNWP